MKIVTAIVMGFLASGLVYLVSKPLPSPAPVLIPIACWAASAFLLQKGTKTAAQVLSRGFLLGTAEWLSLLVFGVLYAALAAPDRAPGIVVRGVVYVFMAVLCLAGFAAIQVWQRIKSPSVQTRL